MKTILSKKYAFFFICIFSVYSLNAQVLFETNFQASEGWVAEGSASSTGTLLTRTITYEGKEFLIEFNQTQIDPTDPATDECSMGSATIQKNGQSDYLKVSTKATNNGYILLPDFNEDIQISFSRAGSSKNDRRIAIETSVDGGLSWQVKEDDIAPLLSSGCKIFTSPSKFAKGTRVRITNHTNGGGLKVYWIQVRKYVEDVIPPTVVWCSPSPDTTEVTPSLRFISLEFSEPVKSGGDGKIYVVGNTSGDLLELTSDGLIYKSETVTIPFSSSFFLNPNETYTVLIEKGAIKDLANNPAEEISWNFTTKVNVSSEKEILSVKIPRMIGTPVINSETATIYITMAFGTDLANIQPSDIVFEVSPLATIINDYKDFSTGPQIYKVIAEDRSEKDWTIILTVADFKVASLPVIYKGDLDHSWKYNVADGWTINLVNDDANTKINNYSFYQASFSKADHFIQNQFNGVANRVSFRARYGNNTSNFKFDVQESADGVEWTNIVSYSPSNLLYDTDGVTVLQPSTSFPDPTPMIPTSSSTIGLRSYPVLPTSRYIRWYYTLRTNTSFYIDDVVIENAPIDVLAPVFDESQPIAGVNYSNNSKAQIIFKLSESVKVSPEVIAKTAGIHITDGTNEVTYYEPNILTLRSGEVVLTDLPALVDQTEYTITIPNNVLMDLAGNVFGGTTFKYKYMVDTRIENQNMNDNKIIIHDNILYISEAQSIHIYNIMGALVKSSNLDTVSMMGLPKGIYIVQYQLQNGLIKTSKILLH